MGRIEHIIINKYHKLKKIKSLKLKLGDNYVYKRREWIRYDTVINTLFKVISQKP